MRIEGDSTLNSDHHRHIRDGVSRRSLLMAALGSPFLLSGCQAGHTVIADPEEADDDGLIIGLTGPPTSLDFTTTDGSAIPLVMMGNVYEGLVQIDTEGHIQPLLAEDWQISEDRRVYTFTLRQGVTFSDGSSFDAETAVFSIERVQNEWTNGLAAGMDVVESATAEGSHQLRVELAEPSNTWLWSMGTLIGAMMSPTGVDDLASSPVGTGPYTVERWSPSQSLLLRVWEDYWGRPPETSSVTIQYFNDATASTNALQYGDVDAVYDMQSPELIPVLDDDDDLVVESGDTTTQVLLSMNHRTAPFDDIRVRQAVMYAIENQAVMDTAWGGYGLDTGGSPTPPTDPWYVESDQYPYDPQRARELLEEAGTPELTVRFSVPTRPYAQQMSEILVSQLRDVGITVEIESLEFPAL